MSRVDLRAMHYPLSDGFCTKYATEMDHLTVPTKLLFQDFLGTKPLKVLDLKNWVMNEELLQLIAAKCVNVVTLILDSSPNLSIAMFRSLRGHKQIKKLSLQGLSCHIDKEFIEVFASMRSLLQLNISRNTVDKDVMALFATTCGTLRTINLSHCKGVDDLSLYALSQCIEHFRCLDKVDLSGSLDFTDEGLLALVTAGRSVLRDIDLSDCTQLSNLSLAGFRGKMSGLRSLQLARMNASSFDFIAETPKSVVKLNLAGNLLLNDTALGIIGKHFRLLETLDVSSCMGLTDDGLISFFSHFHDCGANDVAIRPLCVLKRINMSNCVSLGDGAVRSIAGCCKELAELQLDGLSRVTPAALQLILTQCHQLTLFAMSSSLNAVTSHRKSTMPHVTDLLLKRVRCTLLTSLSLSGACQVTDEGISAISRLCPFLSTLDVSGLHGVTDKALACLASRSARLTDVDLSGCVHITDVGLNILCTGVCAPILRSLRFSGCIKISDKGGVHLARLAKLEVLSLKAVDLLTDASLIAVFSSLTCLRALDLGGCDMLTTECLIPLLQGNPQLTQLDVQKCNLSSTELALLLRSRPLALAFVAPCAVRLSRRPAPVAAFNAFILNDTLPLLAPLRVIVRFFKFLRQNRWKRLIAQHHYHRRRTLRMHLHAWHNSIRSGRRAAKQSEIRDAVFTIQRFIQRSYVAKAARRKLLHKKTAKYSTMLIQRYFRGYAARKRYRKRYARYCYFVNEIGVLLYKFFVVTHARLMKHHQIILQSFGRMVPRRANYRRVLIGIRPLQRRIKCLYRNKQRNLRAVKLKEEERKLHLLRRDQAAKCIQRSLKGIMFNKEMSKFILVCCIVWRSRDDDDQYFSTVLQRHWRGYAVRHGRRLAAERSARREAAALVLQCFFRRMIALRIFMPLRTARRRVLANLRKLFLWSMPTLRLGRYAKTLQRQARVRAFRAERSRACVVIQKVFRGFRGRMKWVGLIADMRDVYASRIQRGMKVFLARRKRKARIARQHMAAFRIFLMVDKFFEIQRRMVRHTEEEAAKRNQLVAGKKTIVTKRREFIVAKIRAAYIDSQATKIQRLVRKHLASTREQEDLEAASLARSSSSLTLGDNTMNSLSAKKSKPSAILHSLAAPGRALNKQVDRLKSIFKPHDLIPHGEEKKFVNAVLTYQVRSILQEGLIDISITVGDVEEKTMASQQRQLRNSHLPYFTKVL